VSKHQATIRCYLPQQVTCIRSYRCSIAIAGTVTVTETVTETDSKHDDNVQRPEQRGSGQKQSIATCGLIDQQDDIQI